MVAFNPEYEPKRNRVGIRFKQSAAVDIPVHVKKPEPIRVAVGLRSGLLDTDNNMREKLFCAMIQLASCGHKVFIFAPQARRYHETAKLIRDVCFHECADKLNLPEQERARLLDEGFGRIYDTMDSEALIGDGPADVAISQNPKPLWCPRRLHLSPEEDAFGLFVRECMQNPKGDLRGVLRDIVEIKRRINGPENQPK